MPMNISNHHQTSSQNRINYSTSFVISNNCLDTCPKCGQNVCEHTSVADVINLPNSVSQDFSTYSSDSSLIKQLFNDSTSSIANNINNRISLTAINQNHYLQNNFFKLNNYQKQQFINYNPNNLNNKNNKFDVKTCNNTNNSNFRTFNNNENKNNNITINNFMPSYTLRPVSCQVMIIDNETSDKLIRDFFDSSNSTRINKTGNDEEVDSPKTVETNAPTTPKTPTTKKRLKFSHFRLFHLKSKDHSSSNGANKQTSRSTFKSGGFVNCLTSSTSSSSCEEIQYKLKSSKSKNKDDTNKVKLAIKNSEETETTMLSGEDDANEIIRQKIKNNKSIMSLNSKFNEEMDAYNELTVNTMNNNSCSIGGLGAVSRDIDADDYDEDENNKTSLLTNDNLCCSPSSSSSSSGSNLTIKSKENNSKNLISVPINNNNLVFNYEKKEISTNTESNNRVTLKLLKNNCYETIHKKERPVSTLETRNMEHNEKLSNKEDLLIAKDKCLSVSQNIIMNKSNLNIHGNKNRAPIEKMSNIISSSLSYNMIDNSCYLDDKTNYDDDTYYEDDHLTKNKTKLNNNNTKNNCNRCSYFSSYSSCDSNSDHSTTLTKTTSTNSYKITELSNHAFVGGEKSPKTKILMMQKPNNKIMSSILDTTITSSSNSSFNNNNSPRYHSISIIFILIGLFTINFIQESFLIFYYFNTEQFYWFVYSIVALFSGQIFTLILSILAELKKSSNKKEDEHLYSIFKNPFSKLFLLVPGYLIASVYIQFFKLVFNYRKASGFTRFILEFQLSLYLFFNGLFRSLPLAIINSCYLASKAKEYASMSPLYYQELFSIFTSSYSYLTSLTSSSQTSSKSTSTAYLLDDKNIERRNLLVLLLVSIFISISIGICLFTTYFELMKQMNCLTGATMLKNNLFFNFNYLINKNDKKMNNETGNNNINNKEEEENEEDENSNMLNQNLGIVEILVYFCFRFCLICSRCSVIALFWYLFNEWLLVALIAHVIFAYVIILISSSCGKKKNRSISSQSKRIETNCNTENKEGLKKLIESSNSNSSSSNNVEKTEITNNDINKKSKSNKVITLFIICILSFVDLFMNQLSELYHIKKVLTYYFLYFIQNLSVLTYWLMLTLFKTRQEQLKMEHGYNDEEENLIRNKSSSIEVMFKSAISTVSHKSNNLLDESSGSALDDEFQPSTFACYATLIYLCIILLNIFGLILKFLHLHILRKRYRKFFEN